MLATGRSRRTIENVAVSIGSTDFQTNNRWGGRPTYKRWEIKAEEEWREIAIQW